MKISEPLLLLPGQGALARPIQDCTELSLGGRHIEQLAGFERLTNLEVVFLHDNQLRFLANLDHNTRLKQLYVHNNRLCTLKGSLTKLKFLTHLDISHNRLKGLDKVLHTLQKLRCLRELNLQGNPCCEEPQYRLTVLAVLPSLEVLDDHQVTTQELQRAARLTASGDIQPPAVAFGTHVPAAAAAVLVQGTQAAAATGSSGASLIPLLQLPPQQQQQQQQQQCTRKQQQRRPQNYSLLEQELAEEVAGIRKRQLDAAAAAEALLYAMNPDAAYWEPRSSLPPNPALLQAQQTWAAATASTPASAGNSSQGSTVSTGVAGPAAAVNRGAGREEGLAAKGMLQRTFSYYHRGTQAAAAAAAHGSCAAEGRTCGCTCVALQAWPVVWGQVACVKYGG